MYLGGMPGEAKGRLFTLLHRMQQGKKKSAFTATLIRGKTLFSLDWDRMENGYNICQVIIVCAAVVEIYCIHLSFLRLSENESKTQQIFSRAKSACGCSR